MIDEVDSASNNQVLLDFLSQLRGYYLHRRKRPTFHSVILAGVYDIKNLKHKIRPDEEHKTNSPWNVSAKFEVEMSFSTEAIGKMLQDYEEDFNTGMNIQEIKIWRGEEYNRRGMEQLGDYLDAYHLKKGYMLSFNFNKDKEIGIKEVIAGDKVIVEAVV